MPFERCCIRERCSETLTLPILLSAVLYAEPNSVKRDEIAARQLHRVAVRLRYDGTDDGQTARVFKSCSRLLSANVLRMRKSGGGIRERLAALKSSFRGVDLAASLSEAASEVLHASFKGMSSFGRRMVRHALPCPKG